jgi:phosphopantetheine--protein transferase-like protein
LLPAFTRALPHGQLAAVDISPAYTADLRAALHPDERAHADDLPPGRQPSFAAGRVALRAAVQAIARDPAEAARLAAHACLPADDGAPLLPPGVLASISHKRTLAVALAAPAPLTGAAALGVDLEEDRRLRVDISRRVLTERERARAAALPPAERDRCLIRHFTLKEAFYKAVNGFGLARVSFRTVEVLDVSANGPVQFAAPLLLEQHLAISGWIGTPIDGYVVASVRADLRAPR